MANAAKLLARTPARMLIVGFPGAGKTGALASLANMGYKIRFLDFDGNTEPLLKFTKPEFLKNIDIQTFEDKLRVGQKFIESAGIPQAFTNALKAMDRWKYTDEDGEEVDLGQSKDWGCDTIVVLDSLTAMGNASLMRVENLLNKTPLNRTQQVWGVAAAEQEKFIEKLTAKSNRFHVIVLAHMKMIGPKDIAASDSELTKDLKERAGELIQTRYFPSALGWALPQTIAQHFPTTLSIELKHKGGDKMERVIRTIPRPDLDIKVPAPNLPDKLDITDGLATIFKAITPPLETCLDTTVGEEPTTTKEGSNV